MSPAQFKSHLAFQIELIQKKEAFAKKEAERLAVQELQENEENLATYERLLDEQALHPATAYPMLVIPACTLPSETLPESRKAEFISRLLALVTEAFKDGFHYSDDDKTAQEKCLANNAPIEQSRALAAINQQSCILCKGGCCTQGANHAYLTTATIHRFREAQEALTLESTIALTVAPTITPEMITQEYVARIPHSSIAGSCIFHTPTGCALTREMRSDTCNGYLCDNLKHYNQQFATGMDTDLAAPTSPPPDSRFKGAVVISRAQDNWHKRNHCGNNEIIQAVVIEVDQDESRTPPLAKRPSDR